MKKRETNFSVFDVGIFEFVPLARHGPETGSEESDLLRENAELTHICTAWNSVDSNYVSSAEIFVDLFEVLFFL